MLLTAGYIMDSTAVKALITSWLRVELRFPLSIHEAVLPRGSR